MLGNRKLFANVKKVYVFNVWNLVAKSSQLTLCSLLLTCLFSQSFSISQLILLLFPLFTRCITFAYFSARLGRPLLGLLYPIHSLIIRTVLDFIVLLFSLFTWNLQIWGGSRSRIVSIKEKSLKSPAFDQLFQKVKLMSLNKDLDDDELLELSSPKSIQRHQFIASKHTEKIPKKDKEWIPLPDSDASSDIEMQKTSSFGTEVFDAINSFGKESSESDGSNLKLNVTKFL